MVSSLSGLPGTSWGWRGSPLSLAHIRFSGQLRRERGLSYQVSAYRGSESRIHCVASSFPQCRGSLRPNRDECPTPISDDLHSCSGPETGLPCVIDSKFQRRKKKTNSLLRGLGLLSCHGVNFPIPIQ